MSSAPTHSEGRGTDRIDRLAKSIDQIGLTFTYKNKPKPEDVFASGLLPAAGYFLCGVLLAPRGVADFLEAVLTEPEAFLGIVYLLTQVALFLQLVTLLSISWNWAAWPLSIFFAFFIVFLGNVMLIACLEGTSTGPDEIVVNSRPRMLDMTRGEVALTLFIFALVYGAGLLPKLGDLLAKRLGPRA